MPNIEMKAPAGKFRVVLTDFFAQPPEDAACDLDTLKEALVRATEAQSEPLTGAQVFDDKGNHIASPAPL